MRMAMETPLWVLGILGLIMLGGWIMGVASVLRDLFTAPPVPPEIPPWEEMYRPDGYTADGKTVTLDGTLLTARVLRARGRNLPDAATGADDDGSDAPTR